MTNFERITEKPEILANFINKVAEDAVTGRGSVRAEGILKWLNAECKEEQFEKWKIGR